MEANKKYLAGYGDGLEIVAEQIKRLAYGDQSHKELLDVINGIIGALHQGKEEITNHLGIEKEAFDNLLVVVNNGEDLISLIKQTGGTHL
jgi:hypothetical protein